MDAFLTEQQRAVRAEARAFADTEVAPLAARIDAEEAIPDDLMAKLAAKGWIGALVPERYGGMGADAMTLGVLCEELGRACSSTRSVLTVQSMLADAFARWGSDAHKEAWLPRLASGEVIGALALTEPGAGSDLKAASTTATKTDDGWVLDGTKRWISFGQVAGVFLVLAASEQGHVVLVVERDRPGLEITPINGMLGTRATTLTELRFTRCALPETALVGRPGFGLSFVAMTALDAGRFTVAWGSVGIAQAALEAALAHVGTRKQFGRALQDHQLVQELITDMAVRTRSARLLCVHAAMLREAGDPDATGETNVAKYAAARTAMQNAADAVQLWGARGCEEGAVVQRLFRDAKIMEIIEGTNQMHQLMIARHVRTTERRK